MPLDNVKFRDYLIDNRYLEAYLFLITASDNLRNRATLLDKNLLQLKENTARMVDKVNSTPNNQLSENLEIAMLVKEVHYSELELIQRINILIEQFAIFHTLSRKDLRDLPISLGVEDFSTRQLYEEFEYCRKTTKTEAYANFRYPDVRNLSDLSLEEQSTLKIILEKSANRIIEALILITDFQYNFRPVYNKYKHSLAEFTGIYGIDTSLYEIKHHIIIRDKPNKAYCTYIIGASNDDFQYFVNVSAKIFTLFSMLIDNALLSIANMGKDFVPRQVFIDKADSETFSHLINRLKTCTYLDFRSRLILKPPNEKDALLINGALKRKHIHVMKRDVLNMEQLLKDGVTFS